VPLIPDDLEHGGGVGRLFEGLTKFSAVEEFGDIGESVEVFLELALGNEEKHDEIDRLVVEGIEIDAFFGAPKSANDFIDEIGRGMGNTNAETDASAHRRFALFDDGGDGVVMFGFDFARGDEVVNELVDGFPAVARVHAGNNLLWAENIA